MSDKKKKFSFLFEGKKDAPTIPVTGAWGGPSIDGNSLVAHYFIEYNSLPHSLEVEPQPDGSVNPNSGKPISRGDITREIQATFVMSPEQALSIGSWMIQNANKMLEHKSNPKQSDDDVSDDK